MKVKCPACAYSINISGEGISSEGKSLKCPMCGKVFRTMSNIDRVDSSIQGDKRKAYLGSLVDKEQDNLKNKGWNYKLGLAKCKSCGNEISKSATSCTHCGVGLPSIGVKCPKCGSKFMTVGQKGFGLGKAAAGGFLLGPVGLLGGLIGRKKIELVCQSCGKKWKPDLKAFS